MLKKIKRMDGNLIIVIGIILIGLGTYFTIHGSSKKEKQEKLYTTCQEILRMNLLLEPYLNKFDNRINLMHKLYNDTDINKDFEFAAIAEILNNIVDTDAGDLNHVTYRVNLYDQYFESQNRVYETIKFSLLKIDLADFPILEDLLTEHIRNIERINTQRLYKQISYDFTEKTIIVDPIDRKTKEIQPRKLQIRAHDINGQDQPNILVPYVRLYNLINQSIVFRVKYNKIIEEIKQQTTNNSYSQ